MNKTDASQTIYVNYMGAMVTIAIDGTAFVDYQNKPEIVGKIKWRVPETTRELSSDNSRFRVYYPKNSLGRLFTDIEVVMS
jgi:hypothetical protein